MRGGGKREDQVSRQEFPGSMRVVGETSLPEKLCILPADARDFVNANIHEFFVEEVLVLLGGRLRLRVATCHDRSHWAQATSAHHARGRRR